MTGSVHPLELDPGHDAFHPSCLGHRAFAAILALAVHGELSRRELATLTGCSTKQVRTAVRRMLDLGVVTTGPDHRLRLAPPPIDWDEIAEATGSNGVRNRRHERHVAASERWHRHNYTTAA